LRTPTEIPVISPSLKVEWILDFGWDWKWGFIRCETFTGFEVKFDCCENIIEFTFRGINSTRSCDSQNIEASPHSWTSRAYFWHSRT
jgi:hypothetical protein